MGEYDKLRDKVNKMVDQLAEKPDLTPQEIKNATDAFCLLHKMNEVERGDAMRDQYWDTYSGYPQSWVASGPYPDYDYGDNYGRRMRSSTTGRYMNGPNPGQRQGGTYGHSIPDRMVASLEDMMDTAHNDYERQMIQNEIKNIRSNNMM